VVAYQNSAEGQVTHVSYCLTTLMRREPQIMPFIVQNLELYTPARGRGMVTKIKSSWIKGLTITGVPSRNRSSRRSFMPHHPSPCGATTMTFSMPRFDNSSQ
jgi:hypothetical protein